MSRFLLGLSCILLTLGGPGAKAQAPSTVFGRCTANAKTPSDMTFCGAQRAGALVGLRRALAKAGLNVEPDTRMIDQYQADGTWDLMRALRLSHGKRIAPATPR